MSNFFLHLNETSFSNSATYNKGEALLDSGTLYVCIQKSKGNALSDLAYWLPIGLATISKQDLTVAIPLDADSIPVAIPVGFSESDLAGVFVKRLTGSEEVGVSGSYSITGSTMTFELINSPSSATSHQLRVKFIKIV